MAAAMLAVSVAALNVASAAQLGVAARDMHNSTKQACSSATLSVHVSPTGLSLGLNKTNVQITNYPAACNGQTVVVGVSNAAGTLLASGTATCGASPCVIATGTYAATQVTDSHVMVATWGVPSNWDSVCTVFLGFILNCT